MNCCECGTQRPGSDRSCRGCGSPVSPLVASPSECDQLLVRSGDGNLRARSLEAADDATARGLTKVIAGDGFFMVAVLLSIAQASGGSLLWLLILIPAFVLFGQGLSDVFKARQTRRRVASLDPAALSPPAGGTVPARSAVALLVSATTQRLGSSSGDLPDR